MTTTTIALLVVGYIAMIFLAVFILTLMFPNVQGDDHGWLAAGAIFWPTSLVIFGLFGIGFVIFLGPGRLAQHLHHTAEEIRRRQRDNRSNL